MLSTSFYQFRAVYRSEFNSDTHIDADDRRNEVELIAHGSLAAAAVGTTRPRAGGDSNAGDDASTRGCDKAKGYTAVSVARSSQSQMSSAEST